MKVIIKLFGILMLISGISLLINPEIIFGWIENNNENTSLYIYAIVVRLVFGLLIIVAARESKYPGVIKIIGYLFIIAAIIFIFMGQESFQDFISPVISYVRSYASVSGPVGGLLGIAFGGFLIYAFSGNKEIEHK